MFRNRRKGMGKEEEESASGYKEMLFVYNKNKKLER